MATGMYTEVENFMINPIITWFKTCMSLIDTMPGEKLTYDSLLDGVLIHRVYRRMNLTIIDDDIEPITDQPSLRWENLRKILGNIRHYFEVELHNIIVKMPNIRRLEKNPDGNTEQLETLLNLLLACAVTCPEKELFIGSITQIDIDDQVAIANCITRAIKTSTYVLTYDVLIAKDELYHEENVIKTLDFIRQLLAERDSLKELVRKRKALPMLASQDCNEDFDFEDVQQALASTNNNDVADEAKRESELLRAKDRERELRIRLDKAGDKLYELRNELDTQNAKYMELKREKDKFEAAAQMIQKYRDQMDEWMEKAARADRLESDIIRYRRKMEEYSANKSRLDQLLEENRTLVQRQLLAEERHSLYRHKAESDIRELERQLQHLEKTTSMLDDLNDSIRCENSELREENEKLEHATKVYATLNRTRTRGEEVEKKIDEEDEDDENEDDEDDDKMSEESPFNASLSDELVLAEMGSQTKMMKVQLEIQRLERIADALQLGSNGSNECTLDVEENRKELNLIVERMKRYTECLTGKSACCVEQNSKDVESQYDALISKNAALTSELEAAKGKINSLDSYIKHQDLARKDLDAKKQELAGLTVEFANLKNDFGRVFRERERLVKSYANLERDYKSLQLTSQSQRAELEMRERELTRCDDQISRLNDRCERYSQNLVELIQEKRHLMESNNAMRRQNQEFILQWMKEFKHFQNEIRDNANKMHGLLRAKERLEEKIMEQYKQPSSSSLLDSPRLGTPNVTDSVKKRSKAKFVRQAFDRLRRGTELFKRRQSGGIEASSTTFEFARGDEAERAITAAAVAEAREGHLRHRAVSTNAEVDDDNLTNDTRRRRTIGTIGSTFYDNSLQLINGDLPSSSRRDLQIDFPFGRRTGIYMNPGSADAFSDYFRAGSREFWTEGDTIAEEQPRPADYSELVTAVVVDVDEDGNMSRPSFDPATRPPMPIPQRNAALMTTDV